MCTFQMYIEWLIKYNVLNPQWVKLAMSPKKPGGGHSKGKNFSGRQRVNSPIYFQFTHIAVSVTMVYADFAITVYCTTYYEQ